MVEYPELKMLQYYRHDLLNEIQLLHGYLQIGNIEQVDQMMASLISNLNEESKLLNLDSRKLILWVIMFNHAHTQIRLTYSINTDSSIKHLDSLIVKDLEKYINVIEKAIKNSDFYTIHLNLYTFEDNLGIKLRIKDADESDLYNCLKGISLVNQMKVTISNNDILCEWLYVI